MSDKIKKVTFVYLADEGDHYSCDLEGNQGGVYVRRADHEHALADVKAKAVEYASIVVRNTMDYREDGGWFVSGGILAQRAAEYLFSIGILEKQPDKNLFRWLPEPKSAEGEG